ncbi:hypothetical protein HMPREF2811_05485 [Globicatella sp. HMSC072A10]|uniref:DUF3800 domain-containing protein n=1 Tax=Globicatella sp. HMSC072A10 TaxID=1739315 RepID=UPI0008C2D31B|nr:DUF3800 domain-containing protein [Globicatella sp. HMSC072A10]OFK58542.1 hypothetical protein HMPREF2811_05485 [Globicatella sp. HMSC072A10]
MINIYCDESCHLENDNKKVMVIGGIACPDYASRKVYEDIKAIKIKHGISVRREIKWSKVSKGERKYYLDLVNYFFDNELLRLRCVLLPDKSILRHSDFSQTHDDFYYKMYYYVLSFFLGDSDDINVYIDIKDTNSMLKIKKLKKVLENKSYSQKNNIDKIQQIRSHESSIIQLADMMIGAISYLNRKLESNETKMEICSLIKERSGQNLNRTTSLSNDKFNILVLDRLF